MERAGDAALINRWGEERLCELLRLLRLGREASRENLCVLNDSLWELWGGCDARRTLR